MTTVIVGGGIMGACTLYELARAGEDCLPLETPREQEIVFEGGSIPHTISSQVDRVYMRPDGNGRLLAGRGYPKDCELVDPDGYDPILGPVDGYDGLFLATGGSGHCFKLGPAIGELVAGAVLGRDVGETFSLSRFDEGRELKSTYGGNRE